MKKIIRSAYSARERVYAPKGGKSATKQSFKDECDINKIMAKYQKTGLVTHLAKNEARYGFATSHDFRESLELVREAEALFYRR